MVSEGRKESHLHPHNQLTLNKDSGRYKLPKAYGPLLTSLPKINSQELCHSADESGSGNRKIQIRKNLGVVIKSLIHLFGLHVLPTQVNFYPN